ncbi:DUF6265 family protein [Proteiniphilum acetatigenes]|uniref:DUF6265 family protein n=1 Tax=Proteiniphilum acetatigenes TaxID=294710 RepID=UPI0004765FF1|nr:DUF6265 family protein [Proteiniphilum acetatigenes]SFL46942.1 hypothetical protein SAMN05216357_12420 [Porphyromonadaceae bacterium KH3CP3RA]
MQTISRIMILFLSLFMIACSSNKSENSNKPLSYTGYDFDFLLGEWNRTNDEEGKRTFENWKKENDSTYIGESFTLRDNDTIWKENTVLSPIDGVWYYQVKMKGDKESTDFKVIDYENNSFTCENRQNEFPKTIRYWKTDNILNAEIADDEIKIPFIFER